MVMDGVACQRMGVVVTMGIERQLAARAEEFEEGGIARDRARVAFAANMMVEADDAIGLAHHHMQIMADQKNAAAEFVAQFGDEMIERRLAGKQQRGKIKQTRSRDWSRE